VFLRISVVKRDFTNSPTYKCVKYIINIVFDRSFASSYTNLSLKSTYCTAAFTGKSIISTIPSNANDGAVANDDAGKIGATLAIISQMAATNGNSATERDGAEVF
jgi:hypothetical protein